MTKSQEYLPLGSIVTLHGNARKLMVTARALVVKNGDQKELYDYGFCLYPEGVLGVSSIFSNQNNISNVLFRGYSDDEDVSMLQNIQEALEFTDVPQGQPQMISVW